MPDRFDEMAKELDKTLFNDLPNEDVPGYRSGSRQKILDRIATALRAAATVPQGHARVGDRDMKVLGTLPVTADGCVAGEQATVWRSADASITNEVRPEVLVLAWMTWSGQFGNVPGDFLMTKASGWYSTRAAATAATAAKGGE